MCCYSTEQNSQIMIQLGKVEETDTLGVALHREAISGTRKSLKKIVLAGK